MTDICGDGRFEIIEKAKKALFNSTNISDSPDEMKMVDNFLFRCWQMGWLDKYDKTAKHISKKECGDCNIWKKLEWYESQDLVRREDVLKVYNSDLCIDFDKEMCESAPNCRCCNIMRIPKAEPPKENE